MRLIVLIVSVLGVLLGGLWLLQGLALVQIEPILCFADCEPVEGSSATWAVIGTLSFAAGIFGIFRWGKHHMRR